jgi:N6-L-threonylcarbamoyladenine synthase
MPVTILAIESSCDETAASVIQDGKILSNVVASQAIHAQYGGIVPELASRAHQLNIVPVVAEALRIANIQKSNINAVACTSGPGLLGALLVGVSFAKSMAYALDIPIIEVNHMKAHILAHFIDDPKPNFPFICLTVSGGHTQLVKVSSPHEMEIVGETMDDAIGEAFDKSAKLLGLTYPGGPLIDKYAQMGNPIYKFPLIDMPGYNYSFSGLKTSILNFLNKESMKEATFIENNMENICASIQKALIDAVLLKLKRLLKDTQIKEVAIAGGVAANKGLRAALMQMKDELSLNVYIPAFEYCTDNAAMIAMSAHYQYLQKDFATLQLSPDPRKRIVLN